jgi:hypothetical protein
VDVSDEVNRFAQYCLAILEHDGIDFMRPAVCVPSTKRILVWMDRRGLVNPEEIREWAVAAMSSWPEAGADFLVAYQADRTHFNIDAVVGSLVTSQTFDAPDTYI